MAQHELRAKNKISYTLLINCVLIIGLSIKVYMILITRSKKTLHVFGLYLTQEVLRCGVGRILISYFFEYAKSENIKLITLRSTFNAVEFYKKINSFQISFIKLEKI